MLLFQFPVHYLVLSLRPEVNISDLIRASQTSLKEAYISWPYLPAGNCWPDFYFFTFMNLFPLQNLFNQDCFPVCSSYKCVPQFFNTNSGTNL